MVIQRWIYDILASEVMIHIIHPHHSLIRHPTLPLLVGLEGIRHDVPITDLGLFGFEIDSGEAGLWMTMVFVCDEDGEEARWVMCVMCDL